MGFSPAEIDTMDMWQFICASDGWEAAHNPDEKAALPELKQDEIRSLLRH
jgi:hypothetical protein